MSHTVERSDRVSAVLGTCLPKRVLLAVSNERLRAQLMGSLDKAGYEVTVFPTGQELVTHLEELQLPNVWMDATLIICENDLPDLTGIEIAEYVNGYIGFPRVILVGGPSGAEERARAEQLGVAAVWDGQLDMNTLVAEVRRIVPV